MLLTNIAKFLAVVILLSACDQGRRKPEIDAETSTYDEPRVVGEMVSREIIESSGLAASQCQDGVLWTHNDSGDGPFIYSVDVNGKTLGVWKVDGAMQTDWEDIALRRDEAGTCHLYIGDIGNTDGLRRTRHRVYRIKEPGILPELRNYTKNAAADTEPAETLEFRYPDTNHDAETLMVHPTTGNIYVLIKSLESPSAIFKLAPGFGDEQPQIATRLRDFSVPAIPSGSVTGGSIAPDGTRLVVCDYAAAYEISLPKGAQDFDEIWTQRPIAFSLGKRRQGEAITYSRDGTSVFATSEKENAPIIQVRKR